MILRLFEFSVVTLFVFCISNKFITSNNFNTFYTFALTFKLFLTFCLTMWSIAICLPCFLICLFKCHSVDCFLFSCYLSDSLLTRINSLSLMSVLVSHLDLIFSMPLSLLLANKYIFLGLFLFLPIVFEYILRIPFLIQNTKVILAFAIPIGVLTTVANKQNKQSLVRIIE